VKFAQKRSVPKWTSDKIGETPKRATTKWAEQKCSRKKDVLPFLVASVS